MVGDFTKISTFLEIVKQKSFSKASKSLNISQPAVTLQIKKLESDLQTTLLVRKKNGVLLTKDGEKFLQLCSKLEDTLLKFEKQARHIKEDKIPLALAACDVAAQIIVPKMLDKIAAVAGTSVDLRSVSLGETREWLLARKCDYAVTSEEIDNSLFHYKKLLEYEVALVSNRPCGALGANDLLERKFIKDKRNSFLKHFFDRFGASYEDFPAAYYLEGVLAVKDALVYNDAEQYFAFLPRMIVESEIAAEKLFVVPIKNVKITKKLYVIGLSENKATVDKIAAIGV